MRNRQNNHINKGDIFMGSGHIWTMWSEEAASATDYEIVHAAGGVSLRLSETAPINFVRKVVRHNVNNVVTRDSATDQFYNPPYVGRIILWD